MGLGRWERIRMMTMKRERGREEGFERTGRISSLCYLCLCYLKPGLPFSIDILC